MKTLTALFVALALSFPALAIVPTATNSIPYTGDNLTKIFPVPFKVLDPIHLVITVNGVVSVYPGEYSVTLLTNTATVKFNTAPPAASAIVIRRVVPFKQGQSFRIQGPLNLGILENTFDNTVMQIQQISPSAAPCGAGQHLTSDGTQFLCSNDTGSSGTLTGAAPATITGSQSSAAAGIASTYVRSDAKPATLYTATGTGAVARTFSSKFDDVVSVKDFGAVGNWNPSTHTGTDDTAAVTAARVYAYANQKALYFPGGTGCYGIDSTALDYGTIGTNTAKLTIYGDGQQMSCIAAVRASQTLIHMVTTAGESLGTVIRDIGVLGYSSLDPSTAHGIFLSDTGGVSAGPSHISISRVYVSGFSGHCIYLPKEWHTTIQDTSANDCHDNLFDIQGGNTTVLIRTYAEGVWSGRAGYRIHGGAVMIAANGINNSYSTGGNVGFRTDQADWLVAGDEVLTAWAPLTAYVFGDLRQNGGEEFECITAGTSAASGGPTTISNNITDGTAHWRHIGGADGTGNNFAKIVCIACNIEDATRTGIRLKGNSLLESIGGQIAPPPGAPAGAANLIGIWAEFNDPNQSPLVIDGMLFANQDQSKYEHTSAIHFTQGLPGLIRFGGTNNQPGIWDRTAARPYVVSTISTCANGGSSGAFIYSANCISRLKVLNSITLGHSTATYGPSIRIDPSVGGNFFDISVTDAAAFSVQLPGDSNSTGGGIEKGMAITECIINSTAGAIGAASFPAGYKLQAAWVQPGAGTRRCIRFEFNGTNWYEMWRSAGDITN